MQCKFWIFASETTTKRSNKHPTWLARQMEKYEHKMLEAALQATTSGLTNTPRVLACSKCLTPSIARVCWSTRSNISHGNTNTIQSMPEWYLSLLAGAWSLLEVLACSNCAVEPVRIADSLICSTLNVGRNFQNFVESCWKLSTELVLCTHQPSFRDKGNPGQRTNGLHSFQEISQTLKSSKISHIIIMRNASHKRV